MLNQGESGVLCKKKKKKNSVLMNKEVKEVVRKENFHQNHCCYFLLKGSEEHRNVLRVVQNLMKEEVNIEMIHQGLCAFTQSIFGRITEYFKYSIKQSQYMKRQSLYLC